ncbi:MAG: methyltransferase domain-containing protein [Saprospiraceae bacterium]|nr:methyltransferase domain-containing protein [Saprospiraceae bacterium]
MACKEGEYNNDSILNTRQKSNVAESAAEDDTQTPLGRAIWQKPGLVIAKLGDISDKVIADIGAGTGYFSFRLAGKAKKVIAVEIDKKFIDYIDSTKIFLPQNVGQKIETRLALHDDPLLKQNEVDIILIINTVAYINDLTSLFSNTEERA